MGPGPSHDFVGVVQNVTVAAHEPHLSLATISPDALAASPRCLHQVTMLAHICAPERTCANQRIVLVVVETGYGKGKQLALAGPVAQALSGAPHVRHPTIIVVPLKRLVPLSSCLSFTLLFRAHNGLTVLKMQH